MAINDFSTFNGTARGNGAAGNYGPDAGAIRTVLYANTMLKRLWNDMLISPCVSSNSDLVSAETNAEVNIMLEPRGAEWRSYESGQRLVPSKAELDSIMLTLNNPYYSFLKFNLVDLYKNSGSGRTQIVIPANTAATMKRLPVLYTDYILAMWRALGWPMNKGNNSGIDGQTNFGTDAVPLNVTPENFHLILSRAMVQLMRVNMWQGNPVGEFYLYGGAEMKGVILDSPQFRNYNYGGDRFGLFKYDGKLADPLGGFMPIADPLNKPAMVNDKLVHTLYIVSTRATAWSARMLYEGQEMMGQDDFDPAVKMLEEHGGWVPYGQGIIEVKYTINSGDITLDPVA